MLYSILNNHLSEKIKSHIFWDSDGTNAIIGALDYSLITNGLSLSTVHWAKQYPVEIKRISFVLSQLGFTHSIVTAKWNELQLIPGKLLEFVSQDEIDEYVVDWSMDQYLLRLDKEVYPDNLSKTNSGIKSVGLKRAGFAKVAKNEFKFDRDTLLKYRESIELTLNKSIRVAIKDGNIKDKFFANPANYEKVVTMCIQSYIDNDNSYNLEKNISCARGRATYQALKRVFNPVSSKDSRSLLVVPSSITMTTNSTIELNDIYYFIAELMGTKNKTPTESSKIFAGKAAYRTRRLPNLDLSLEADRKDLHELIWLERIYAKLDELYINGSVQWDIPLEVDASMSIAQFVAALTNELRLMERTNMVGTTLSDPWFIPGVARLSGKKVGTPRFYGSSASASKLLRKAGITPITSEIKAINRMFAKGDFSIINKFKNALISNYSNHKPIIDVCIWGESFTLECTKHKAVDSRILVTEAWDSNRGLFHKSITREPITVPDYDYFSLYFATLLIHNLDSQVMNNIALLINEWMLTIHDAAIALPGTCGRIRGMYANQLQQINTDRFSIMRYYRNSIGATSIKTDMDFMDLYNSVQQAPAGVIFQRTAMK